MTELRWTEQAADDLRSIREFVERDSLKYGRLVAERLFDAASRLRTFPRSGRVARETARDDLREIVAGDYRIIDAAGRLRFAKWLDRTSPGYWRRSGVIDTGGSSPSRAPLERLNRPGSGQMSRPRHSARPSTSAACPS